MKGIELLSAFYRVTVNRHFTREPRHRLLRLWAVIGGMELGSNDEQQLMAMNDRVEALRIECPEDAKFFLWLFSDEEDHELSAAVKALADAYEYAHGKEYDMSFLTPISWREAVFNGDGYDKDLRIERGMILYAEEHYDQALKAWSSVECVEARRYMAALYEIMGDYQNALLQVLIVEETLKNKLLFTSAPFLDSLEAAQNNLLSRIDPQVAADIRQKAALAYQQSRPRDRVIGFS